MEPTNDPSHLDHEDELLFRRVYRLQKLFLNEGESIDGFTFLSSSTLPSGGVMWNVNRKNPNHAADPLNTEEFFLEYLSEEECLYRIWLYLQDAGKRARAAYHAGVTSNISTTGPQHDTWGGLSVESRHKWILYAFEYLPEIDDDTDLIETRKAQNFMSILRLPTPNLILGDVRLIAPLDPDNPGGRWQVETVEKQDNMMSLKEGAIISIVSHGRGNASDKQQKKFSMSGSQVFDLCRFEAKHRAMSLQFESNEDSGSYGIAGRQKGWDSLPAKDRENWIARALNEMRNEIPSPQKADFADKNLIRDVGSSRGDRPARNTRVNDTPAVDSSLQSSQDDPPMNPMERPYLRVVRQRPGI